MFLPNNILTPNQQKYQMDWADFSDAISIFITSQDRIFPFLSKKLAEEAVSILELSPADGVKNLGANALVDFINNLFRRSENGEIQQRMMTLEMLVSSLIAFESSDPRDTIYAVLSLAKDTQRLGAEANERELDPRLSPEYKMKCLLDVYTDFIAYCIDKSQSLDILLRHWAPDGKKEKKARFFIKREEEEEEELPTWIPLLQKSSYGTPSRRPGGRKNGDSFVGTPFRTSHKNYNAASDLRPMIIFSELPGGEERKKKYNGRLKVKGLRIGKITELSPPAPQGMILHDVLQMAKFDSDWWEETGKKEWAREIPRVPEGFWRTIVADRSSSNGGNTESWYPLACSESLKNLYPDYSLRPDVVIGLPKAPKIVKDFLNRVKDVMWYRRFARINVNGKETYGLLPADTKKRDILCVLFGSSVPVVIRPRKKGKKKYWEMVGECFCYGQMEGEAVSGKEWIYPYEDAECFELR